MISAQQTTMKTASPAPTPVHALMDLLAHEVSALNKAISGRMQSPVPLVNQLGTYIIASGGKRLRPLLTLTIANALGYSGDSHITLAAAVEFIHTATLLHDDVVDESSQRRGQVAAHMVFGNQASVLVGDYLFSRAFQLMVETHNLRVLDILSHASAVIAEGEVMQLAATGNIELSRDEYFDLITAKTAALFAAACEAPAVLAQADKRTTAACRQYGETLGIAFQIADDILDYQGDETLGKNTGDDFKEGKITLPVVIAMEEANDEERAFWYRTLVEQQLQDKDFATAQQILKRHNAFAKASLLAEEYVRQAQAALASLPQNALTATLSQLADFSLHRNR